MNGYLTKYLNKLKAEKKKQKQAVAFITALSLVVSGTVSWQLRGIGTAMVDDNLAESPDENISTLSADAELCENPVMWEAALPDIRGLGISESTALIAESQLGYEENTLNFVLDADGETHRCYTRYGDWYGNPYGEWNTMFTYFCMKYGGVDEETIPFGSGCWAWSLELEDKELLVPADRGSPSRGNAVLFDTDLDGQADRSGIVSEADMDSDEPVFRVIEGNVEGTVAEREYTPGDETIVGYLPLEVTEDTEADEPEAEEAAEPMEFSGVSESGVEVRAVADEGAFPEGAVMTVTDIDRDEALKTAAESLEADKDKVDAVAVDISFSSADGSEIEPAADTTVQVQIILPDELRLSGGEYSLLHVADSGDVQKVEDAEVSQDGAEFLAGEFSIYVLTSDGTPVDKDQVIKVNGVAVPNSADNPYVLYIGDIINIQTEAENWTHQQWGQQGFPYGYNEVISVNTDSSKSTTELIKCDCEIKALKVGETQINLTADSTGRSEIFYIKVIDNTIPEIYVNTALGERSKDEVHEYLNLFADWYNSHPEDFITVTSSDGTTQIPKYVKNNDGDNTGNWQYGFKPYRMSVGDTVELVAYVPASKANDYSFVSASRGTHDRTDLINVTNHPDELLGDGRVRKSATVTAINSYGSKKTGVAFGGNYFYITVDSDDLQVTHADIEIDDGGSYTFIKESIENGQKVTEKYVYAAQVKKVNTCKIYGLKSETNEYEPLKVVGQTTVTYANGNSMGKEAGSSETIQSENYGQDVVFYDNDYYNLSLLTAQASQYEWTSNYISLEEHPHSSDYNIIHYEGGRVYLRDDSPETNKNFYLKDAQKAVFDVDLDLTLQSAVRIIGNTSTDITSSVEQNGTVSNVIFPLYRRDILDAYNKCPFHTGLDFTLAANAVMVDFSLKKDYVGSNFSAGDFTFELCDKNGTPTEITASNDANGKVEFKNLYFDKIGTYTYTIREVKGTREDVIYDNVPKSINIVVTNNGAALTADISEDELKQKFTNYQTYTLPATGGGGIVPYMLVGMVFISGASVLLIRSRRREED